MHGALLIRLVQFASMRTNLTHPHPADELAAGAHTLGRCHTDRSGFLGPWTNAPTTFSNLYFQVGGWPC